MLSLSLFAVQAIAVLPYQNPTWKPTYNMTLSTITMTMNQSGLIPNEYGAIWGVQSLDWSNGKAIWAANKPMNCEELLVKQAVQIKEANPDGHVWVYRNFVKALPWYTTVREKLDDPAYEGWFLKFDPKVTNYSVPQCDLTQKDKCSIFYHDQEQTPQVPTASNPNPDGKCVDYCDSGKNPTGEYLFDHRNTSLRQWIVDELIAGPTGLGHPLIDGVFMDDFWCSNILNGTCGDPVQGPSEIDRNNQHDMGLSDQDVLDITKAYYETMDVVQKKIVSLGKYTWWFLPGDFNAMYGGRSVDQGYCKAFLEYACAGNFEKLPLVHGINIGNESYPAPTITQDIAIFLIARGPYAWVTSAQNYGTNWPVHWNWDGVNDPKRVRPIAMDTDYGEPLDKCHQEGSFFSRHYTKAYVTMNCSDFTGNIQMK